MNAPFTTELRINEYQSERENGMYLGQLDTGANMAAMQTVFVKNNKFPIFAVKRPFYAETANGSVIIRYATILEIENETDQHEKYWMKTIFYLLDELKVNIILDRRMIRLMRLLGPGTNEKLKTTFRHKATTTTALTEADNTFFDKLVNPDDVVPIPVKPKPTDNLSDAEVDYGDTAHDPDAIIDDEYTIEGDALPKALFRSTFETTNSSTKTGDDEHHTYDPNIDNTHGNADKPKIYVIDKPLSINKSTELRKHLVVDEDNNIIDEFVNHTYGDTFGNIKDDPNSIDEDLKLDNEDDTDLVKLPKHTLKRRLFNDLYQHSKFINANDDMERELFQKFADNTAKRLIYPKPPGLHKVEAGDISRRQLYQIEIDEKTLNSLDIGAIQSDDIMIEFNKMLNRYQNTMAKSWADCGKIEGVYLKLDLKPGAKPFKYTPYKTGFEQMDEIDKQCNKLLEAGFIRPSNSNFASPVLMVPKKIVGDNPLEWRMCIDYRKLNSMTIPDHYPLPNIQSIYRRFAGNHFFSSLDLRHAYHHIEIRPQDRHKTAFITHKGLFEWIRMTFGFSNAPAAFQRAINYIFRDLDFVIIYLDDILILSKTEGEHMKHLRLVFKRLSEYNLKLRIDKCKFFAKELKYLGFILNSYGIKPDPEYVRKVIALQIPTGKKSLLRVLGMINWLHRYIPRLSDYLWPLTKLTRKSQTFDWNDECDLAFTKIKKLVSNTQILRHPNLSETFYVVCDASNFGIGAVLMQKHDDKLYPCEYWSKLFGDNEKHWHVSEKEVSAIVFSLEKWQKYLLGRHFHVFTDHKNLEVLHTKFANNSLGNAKLLRWLIRMEPFDFTCHYIKGIHNVAADYLSRDICMEQAQRQRDKINNEHSIDYSVLLNKKSIHFIKRNAKTNDCDATYTVLENGELKQIHTLSKQHVFYTAATRRRSARLLAKKQREKLLKRLGGKPCTGKINEIPNQDRHSRYKAKTRMSTAGSSGNEVAVRTPRLSHSVRAGGNSKAASDGVRPTGVVASESSPDNRSNHNDDKMIGSSDVVADRNRPGFGMDNREVFTNGGRAVHKSNRRKSRKNTPNDNEFTMDEIEEILDDDDEYDRNISKLIDINFESMINPTILYNTLMDDSIYGTIMRILQDRITNELLLYTLAKSYQSDIYNNQYMLKNNLLYYVPKRSYIIPPRLRHPVMEYFHKSLHTLHQGVERMIKLMKNRVYWPNMNNEIREYIANCRPCRVGKQTPNRREGYMQLFPVHKPFEIVHMDIVGPLPVTRSGNRYILTIMDRYSRMVKLVPLSVTTASAICLAFRDNWLLQFGVPDNTLTDRGTYFTGLLFRILSKIFGFDLKFTTAYHPKTNGRLERFHRYLKQRLRVLAEERGLDFLDSDDWDIYLPNIAFSYNITPNRMTGYSPYQIIYDDWIKLPIDRMLNTDIDEVVDDQLRYFKNQKNTRLRMKKLDAEHRAGITALRNRRHHLQKEIQETRIKYDTKRKEIYDRKREPASHYGPNQEVWVDVSVGKVGNAQKLGINRKRAIIVDQIGENTYVVEYNDGKVEPVNVERMYTVIRKSNNDIRNNDNPIPVKKGKNANRNFKKRQRKRARRNSMNDSNPNKRRRYKY